MVCGFVKGGSRYVLAYSSSGAEVSVSVPSGLTSACGIDGVCTPVTGGKISVGISPVRVS